MPPVLGSPLWMLPQDIIKISFMALKCFVCVCGLWVAFTFSSGQEPQNLGLQLQLWGPESRVSGVEIYATFGQSKLCIKKPGEVKPVCLMMKCSKIYNASCGNLLSARVEFIRQKFTVYELLSQRVLINCWPSAC